MDIKKSLEELDKLFAEKKINEVDGFLKGKLKEAEEEDDTNSIITLVNELIGFYRVTSRFNDCLVYCDYIVSLMEELELKGTIPYATTLLNVATALRAAGKSEEALEYYSQVLEIYIVNLKNNDFRFASLYNNMSLLYQEMKEYNKACDCLKKALEIVVQYKGSEIEAAVTHSNLAMSLLKLDKTDEAVKHIEEALDIFEKSSAQEDIHYPSALSAMGEAQFKLKNYDKAIDYYLNSLKAIKSSLGENKSYGITCSNLSVVYKEIGNVSEADKYKSKAEEISAKLKK